jgi:AcrR family transcriptional regulator
MSRILPTPQSFVDMITKFLPDANSSESDAGVSTEERILNAALAEFTTNGIRSTTMSKIASQAGISREWLYKHFRNRDAVVVAVANREVLRFVDGLAVRAFSSAKLAEALTDVFVYSVEYMRDHPLLQRVLDTEADILSPHLLKDSTSVIGVAVTAGAGYLSAFGDLTPDDATVVAETLVRIVASVTLAPRGSVNLQDPLQLRNYAESMVPALLSGFSKPVDLSSRIFGSAEGAATSLH